MLTPAQKDIVGRIVEGVKQKRVQAQQAAQQAQQAQQDRAHQVGMEHVKSAGQARIAAAKPAAGTTSKPKSGAKPAAAKSTSAAAQPYLTGNDLMAVSDRTAQAENADAESRFSLAKAAGDALVASGDIERSRVKGVSAANDDAAARGLYDSGIRAGNVGMANAAAARGQSQVRGSLGMAAAQAIAQQQAARNQLNDFLSASTVKAAENAAALPVDPYAATPGQGSNVKGAATARKTTTTRRPSARLKPGGGGKALIR